MKRDHRNSIEKRSVSAPLDLFSEAEKRARVKRMSNFSEYVRDLIRRDLNGDLNTQPAKKEQVAA